MVRSTIGDLFLLFSLIYLNVKEMKEKYGISVLHGLAMIYTSYNAEGAGMSINELFTGYTYKSSEIPYIRGGGFNVRIPNINRKKPEFKTMTRAELDKFVKSVKDRRSKDDPRNTTVPKETLEPPNTSNSTKGMGNTSSIRSKGKPYENHTTAQKTDTVRNLPTTGKPNSSVDFYDEKGTLTQRRYYDKNGRAIEDIDYEHSNGDNSHEFPHRHTWDWSSGSPKRSK